MSPPLSAKIQGLKGSMEEEEVDRMVSPPILKRERDEEQRVSPLWVTGELGSPTTKPPPDTRSPEGGGGEMDLLGGNKPVEVPDPEDSSTMEVSGHILRTTAQGTPDGRIGLVTGECGVKYGKERGRGSWHGYISF